MKKKDDRKKTGPKSKKVTDLRKRAEKKISESMKNVRDMSDVKVQELIHDLQVHQKELEIQNEALQKSQIDAEESHRKYADLYDFAPIGYFTFDKKGHIIETNVAGASLLGSEKRSLIGQPFQRFITPGNFSIFKDHLQVALEIPIKQSCKLKLTRKDGRLFDALIETIAVTGSNNKLDHYRSSVTDITEIMEADAEIAGLASSPMLNPNPIAEVDFAGQVYYLNIAAERLFPGLRKRGPEHPWLADWESLVRNLRDGGKKVSIREVKVDGRWCQQTLHLVEETRRIRIYGTDITERKQAEEELKRLNRTLKAISDSSQAMMRSTNETELLHEVCRIIVEDCCHAMVWIGYAEENEAKTVRPVAYAGFEEGYVETLKITWADTKRGRGPMGTAIRTGKPSACRNMLTDPLFKPWRKEATERGYASSIVLPLMAGGRAFGAVSIYSREPDPFSADEVKLLTELADDLAYGITVTRFRAVYDKAKEALRESEERYHTLFSSMTDGFALHEIICNDKGKPCDYRFLDINPAFERLTGLKREEVVGRTVNEVLPNNDTYWLEIYGKVALTGESVHFENYASSLDRHYEILTYRPAPRQFATIFTDVTQRKKMEEDLKHRTLELEDVNKELESFSYSVSHDLRAPLRAIDGYARLILKKQGDKFDQDTLDKFNVIRSSTHMMGQLIDDLLTFSRLGRKHMSLTRVEMDILMRDAWKEVQTSDPERNIKFTANSMPPGHGDRALIKQVLINLLSNAAKFTKYKDAAEIVVGGYADRNEHVYYVRDNGVGFDMVYYDKLFGVFQRLHSTDQFEGTGVGLATVQRIIHRHGGRVWAEGKVDEGATFYFSLPPSHTRTQTQ
ncbi:MAG: PAS domain S-box protein [Syntrophales bacterium]